MMGLGKESVLSIFLLFNSQHTQESCLSMVSLGKESVLSIFLELLALLFNSQHTQESCHMVSLEKEHRSFKWINFPGIATVAL